jgi:ssDNA-binding Zn-finger/Zn-ribbon topoisomerase 1
MRRLPFARTCEELIDLHKLGSDKEVAPGTRRPIQTDRKCQKCSVTMVLVRGPHSVFVGCMDYPKCNNRYPIRRGDRIVTDVICPGKDGVACEKPMIAVLGPYGVYLKCSDATCKASRNIP